MLAARSITKLFILVAGLFASSLTAATLVLENPDISGVAGETAGWGFTLEGDSDYWLVVTSVQSIFDGSGGGVAATDPAVTDYLSLWFLNNNFSLAPGATLQQAFVAGSTGLGSIQLLAGLPAGTAEWGGLFVTYDLYDGDPLQGGWQVFPTTDPGFFWLDASVTVDQGHAEVPEPSAVLLLAGGLILLLVRKKRWSSVRLGLLVIVAATGWAQQQQCAQVTTNLGLRPEERAALLGDIWIACYSAPVSPGIVSVKVQLPDHVRITNRFVDVGTQKTDATAESQNTVSGVVSPGTPNTIEFSGVQFDGNGILITKIRADIYSASTAVGIFSPINAQVTVTFADNSQMMIANNPSLIGTILPASIRYSLRDSLSEDSISQVSLKQCEGSNPALALNPTSGSPNAPSFYVNISENFTNAIRSKYGEGILPDEPGTGTRVRVLFENVPDGLQLFAGVKDNAPDYTGDPDGFNVPARLHLIDHDETLSGTSIESLPLLSPTNPAAGGIRPLRAMGDGKFMGVWENIGKGSGVLDALDIPIYAAFQPNAIQGTLPANIQMKVGFAPYSEDGSAGSDIIPRFGFPGVTFNPIRIESCVCSTRLLSRLSMKSGLLTNRQWTLVVTNIGGTPVKNGVVKPQITRVAGTGTAALLGAASISLPEIPAGGSVQVVIPIAFSGTGATSRFALKTDLTGGCFTGTATINNQAP